MKIIIALFSTLLAQKKVWWGKCPEVPLIANFDLDRVSLNKVGCVFPMALHGFIRNSGEISIGKNHSTDITG